MLYSRRSVMVTAHVAIRPSQASFALCFLFDAREMVVTVVAYEMDKSWYVGSTETLERSHTDAARKYLSCISLQFSSRDIKHFTMPPPSKHEPRGKVDLLQSIIPHLSLISEHATMASQNARGRQSTGSSRANLASSPPLY